MPHYNLKDHQQDFDLIRERLTAKVRGQVEWQQKMGYNVFVLELRDYPEELLEGVLDQYRGEGWVISQKKMSRDNGRYHFTKSTENSL